MMKKQKVEKFGTHYLLGKDADGTKYWLEAPRRECDWYWSMGYVHTYTNNRCPERSADIDIDEDFDTLFSHLNGDCNEKTVNFYDGFRSLIKKTPLTDNELWRLCNLFNGAYTIQTASEVFKKGGMYTDANDSALKSDEMAEMINKKMLPAVFDEIKKILEPGE